MAKKTEFYSFSKVQCFFKCPKKFYYQYVIRLFIKKKATPLALGACMAVGISDFRKNGDIEKAQEAFTLQWEEDGKVLALRREDDDLRSVERGLEILTGYMEYYPEEPSEIIRPEISFEEDMGDFIFRGRIDAVFSDRQGIAIVEDKTVSRLGETWFKELLGGWQVCWYMAIAKQLGLFDVLRKNQTPRCIANAIYIHPTKYRYERDITMKSNKTLDNAVIQLKKWVKVISQAIEMDLFPMADSDRCNQYNGCEYKRLCAVTSDKVSEILIDNDFEYRKPHN